jgi:hypothetical protein
MKLPEFNSKEDRIKYLVENKSRLIRLKKAETKYADVVGLPSGGAKLFTNKADTDTDSNISRTLVLNTYNWMDSHDDVHMKGVFTKSIKENGDKVLHLHDHLFQLTAQVGKVQKVYESTIPWSSLGVDYKGDANVLLMDSDIRKSMNENIFDQYKEGSIQQHSVGMQYVKLELAINDDSYEDEHKIWKQYIGDVVNADKADEVGYFWAVTEAKLIEGSAVIRGSNELTPTIEPKQYPDIDALRPLVELVSACPTEKNVLHLYSQFDALIKGEPLELALEEEIKPRSFNKSLTQKLLK